MIKEIQESNFSLEREIVPANITINADKQLIEQVLINLVKNAIESFDDESTGKKILIRAGYNDKSRPVISVRDNGQGIDEEALQRIFIPFFTTKKKGSGIGLSLSRQIMRQHKGSLTVNSEIGTGSEFSLRF